VRWGRVLEVKNVHDTSVLTVVKVVSPVMKPAPHKSRQQADASESQSESDIIPRDHPGDLGGVLERDSIRFKLVDNE